MLLRALRATPATGRLRLGKRAPRPQEARWILFAALAAWLTLVLATWSPADPGWSHSVSGDAIHNGGGTLGAYLADILLYLFGFSAWWWSSAAALRARRLPPPGQQPARHQSGKAARRLAARALGRVGIGFVLLLTGSLGIEALRLYSWGMHLPGGTDGESGAGGVIGQMLAGWLSRGVGFTGGTLALLVLLAVGLSLFFSFRGCRSPNGSAAGSKAWCGACAIRTPRARTARSARSPRRSVPSRWWPSRKSWCTSSLCASSPPLSAALRIAPRRKSSKACSRRRSARATCRPSGCWILPAEPGNRFRRDDRIHLAPDREETGRFRRFRGRGGGAGRPGDHAYEIEPATGVKGSQIVNLAKDLARASAWSASAWWKPSRART